ncbi:nuclear transport factor 2 family protein [Mycolicibacterium goodii]|uniref:nuclear transport factor 2 family protein n=1 Tax=Mycolicibacterium goodii TaxID=134601 RepID=UPI001BDCBF8C|nr:nuclear transport factor 2 family protein [Mycolicibacterium goodii]MBU8808170.1 nuclear transport factor 2 family protein [Mycolicibacterium goodii]
MTIEQSKTAAVEANRVDQLLAKREIHDVMLAYLRGADRLDADLIEFAYHPDAVDDHGGYEFRGRGIGKALVPLLRDLFTSTFHFLGNHHIELDGTVAYSEAYVLGYYTAVDDKGDYLLIRALRYIDEFSLHDGRWKIARRRIIREWDRIDRNQERPEDRPYQVAKRNRHDISYERGVSS